MKGLQTPRLNEVAFLSNTIIRSPLYLNNIEARIFALALGCLHQREDSLNFAIHFNDVTNNKRGGGSQYQMMHAARARLTQPLISNQKTNGKRRSDAIPLFSIITLDESTSMITGQFNSLLRDYLLGLARQFTTVELESLLMLSSAHSQRLFWILRSYHNQSWREAIPFETLRDWLFGENSDMYPLWPEFQRSLLKPAIEEFATIGWKVEVEVIKRGRKVAELVFQMTNLEDKKVVGVVPVGGKKLLTLVEIAQFREELGGRLAELPALYDRLRSDFELKEYQAREVVTHITTLNDFRTVQKALHEVLVELSNKKVIKSLPAFTLSKIKAVLPIYQQAELLIVPPTALAAATPPAAPVRRAGRGTSPSKQKLRSELADAQGSLDFVLREAPDTLYTPGERQARVAEIEAKIVVIKQQLAD